MYRVYIFRKPLKPLYHNGGPYDLTLTCDLFKEKRGILKGDYVKTEKVTLYVPGKYKICIFLF